MLLAEGPESLSTQEPPILRLLLAVLYRALEVPMNDADWSALWRVEELPKKRIDAYLERWRSRFRPTRPQGAVLPGGRPRGHEWRRRRTRDECHQMDRMGPYPTREDAENWRERVAARNEAWDKDE
jgi:hypothetical protein